MVLIRTHIEQVLLELIYSSGKVRGTSRRKQSVFNLFLFVTTNINNKNRMVYNKLN